MRRRDGASEPSQCRDRQIGVDGALIKTEHLGPEPRGHELVAAGHRRPRAKFVVVDAARAVRQRPERREPRVFNLAARNSVAAPPGRR